MTDDLALVRAAITAADSARLRTAPNPWVGAALRTVDGRVFTGATQPPGGAHAEVEALRAATAAGASTAGATLASTLEPCSHEGRTGPCARAIVDAGIARVIVGLEDPDPKVAGRGFRMLRDAGIEVAVGMCADDVALQLAPYLHHRRTGRPYVVLKLASSLDGRTAAPDRSSQWITGEAARADAHRLRAESQAIVVGSGTVRDDDPSLTVRLVEGPDPLRVVLGSAPAGAKVHPCWERRVPIPDLLDELGAHGVLQVLVEGGATVARSFHLGGFVNRYVLYLAPVLFGGDDALGLFRGPGAATIADVWRGRIERVTRLGHDLRVDLVP